MNIPSRSYTPGEVDPVLHRTVPTTEPDPAEYARTNPDPGTFITDLILFKRSKADAAALKFDIERALSDDPDEMLDLAVLEKVVTDFDASGTPNGIMFLLEVLQPLHNWATVAYSISGGPVPPPNSTVIDSAKDILAAGGKSAQMLDAQMREYFDAIGGGKSSAEALKEQQDALREKMRSSFTPAPAPKTSGLIGRVADAPATKDTRTTLTERERETLAESFEPFFMVVRNAVNEIYSREPKRIAEGLRVLDMMIKSSAHIAEMGREVRDEIFAEHGSVRGDAERKLLYHENMLEQTRILRIIMDPSQVDDEQLLSIANALNIEFLQDIRDKQIKGNLAAHGDHEECHVRDAGFDLLRVPYQRIYSLDPEVDNTLPELPEISGILLDANDSTIMPYSLVFHPALVSPSEDALHTQMDNGGLQAVQRIVGEWAQENISFMQFFRIESTNKLLSELGDKIEGDIPRNAMGAALAITPGVFSPQPQHLRNVLATVLNPLGDPELDADTELTIPADWMEDETPESRDQQEGGAE